MISDYAHAAVVYFRLCGSVRKPHAFDVVSDCKGLKFAFAVVCASGAISAMVRKQQLQNHFSVFPQPFGVGFYRHACPRRSAASGFDAASFVLYHAHTASAVNGQLAVIAESRHLYAKLSYDFQNVLFACYFNGEAVNRHELFFFHFQPSLIALKLQFETQEPHFMHLFWSITNGFLISPLIAPTGQFLAHFEQPLHTDGSMT